MHEQTAVLLLAVAVLLLPAVQAQAMPVDPATLTQAVADGTGLPVDPASLGSASLDTTQIPTPALDGLPIEVSASAEAQADVGVAPPSPTTLDDPPAHEPRPLDHLVQIAAPAAAPTILVTLLGFLAFGSGAVKAMLARVVGALARSGRGAAAAVLAIPLFSRIERDRLMDNPARARVHDAIAQDPGLSLTEVAARTGVAWGTAVHHLRRLESHGLLVSKRQGERRYFIANTPAAAQRSAVAVVMHPTARRIAQLVGQRPGIDQTGICQTLHLNNPAASKHLGHFEEKGLVVSQRVGRNRIYQPTGALHAALLVLDPVLPPTPGVAAASPPLFGLQRVASW